MEEDKEDEHDVIASTSEKNVHKEWGVTKSA